MNIFTLAWKNLMSKPLAMLLSLLLFGLGVGIVVFLLLLNKQVENNFENNLAKIDCVIGAKGSPMQLILSSMYHIDAPTGNIPVKSIKPFLNPKHPVVKNAYPVSLGDNYRNFRIVGTEHKLIDLYNGKIEKGKLWDQNYEVVIGSFVCSKLGLKIGDKFHSSHGLVEDGLNVHDHGQKFEVVGILEASGTVLDQLILCNTPTIWVVHDHDHDVHETDTLMELDESLPPGSSNVETVPKKFELANAEGKDITALLVQFKGRGVQALNFPRGINGNTDLMAAQPAWQINRVRDMMGSGTEVLRLLAMAIIFVSAISLFISLFSSLRGRKYELAIIRVIGGSRFTLLSLILLEGLLLAAIGYVIGIIMGHGAMYFLGAQLEASYKYSFTAWMWLREEWFILAVVLLIGLLASILPAVKASRTDISETLGGA